jgi:hypothetical protein
MELEESGPKDSRMQKAREWVGRLLGSTSGDAIEKSMGRLRKVDGLYFDFVSRRFKMDPAAEIMAQLPSHRGRPAKA